MPSFSSPELKILFMDQEPETRIQVPVTKGAIEKGIKALECGFQRVKTFKKSTKMLVFCSGNCFLRRDDVNAIVKVGIELGGTVVETMDDFVIFKTRSGFHLTLRFVGGTRNFYDPENPQGVPEGVTTSESDLTEESKPAAKTKTSRKRKLEPASVPKPKTTVKKDPKKPSSTKQDSDSEDSGFGDWRNQGMTQTLR